MSGWFGVKRGITSHHIFKGKPERLAVWVWLMDNAVWKDTKHDVNGKTVTIKRGSICASERRIASEVGVGYQVVRTAIKRFKSEHMVNTDLTHGKSVLTLCNYEKYQDPKNPINAAVTQQQRSTNAQKKQGNNITRDTNVSLDARAADILASICSHEVATDFTAHRRDMKKPLTERAAKAIVNKLSKHPSPDACLNDSIANGWQGVFPEKTQTQKKEKPNGNDIAEEVARLRQVDRREDTNPVVPLLRSRDSIRR